MTDEAPFLAAINDHPDDPAPRLVYADWLEERGEPDHKVALMRLEGYERAVISRPDVLDQRLDYAGACERFAHVDATPCDHYMNPEYKVNAWGRCLKCAENRLAHPKYTHLERRAKLIRAQIDLYKLGQIVDPAQTQYGQTLTDTIWDILGLGAAQVQSWCHYEGYACCSSIQADATWITEPDILVGDPPLYLGGVVRLGFVDEIVATWQSWVEHASAVLKQFPVTKVRLLTHPMWRWHNVSNTHIVLLPNHYLDRDEQIIGRPYQVGPEDFNEHFHVVVKRLLSQTWPTVRVWQTPNDICNDPHDPYYRDDYRRRQRFVRLALASRISGLPENSPAPSEPELTEPRGNMGRRRRRN